MSNENFYDVVVIGGGPAGLTAALYLARACYRVLVIEKEKFGGQITITAEVVNYPGVEKTSGKELTATMQKQAEHFGAEFLLGEVASLKKAEAPSGAEIWETTTDKGSYQSFGILLATGAHPRMIGFPGEAKFRGHGVAYCATCDGEFFRGKEIFVVGGGFAAAEESVFLTKYASYVTILIRGNDFSCAEAVAEAAKNHPKITVLTNTEVVYVEGDHTLRKICYKNKNTGEETIFDSADDTFGVFVFAGYAPNTDLVKDLIALDSHGYVETDRTQKTSYPGIYAAGDVCQKNLRQVVTAVGDGATAATELEKYAAAMQEKTGIHPEKPIKKETDVHKEPPAGKETEGKSSADIFSQDIVNQLNVVFSRMEGNLQLDLHLDSRPVSQELKGYMTELEKYTDKLTVQESNSASDSVSLLPFVEVLTASGEKTGLAFHGVPGGHEFTSFILGLYNAAGPGQPLDPAIRKKILAIDHRVQMQILVSLSCTMCPDLVVAAQRIASLNPLVTAEVYDIAHFPDLKEKYNVMSVPCLVINQDQVTFGKKNIPQLLELL
ncbi:MAG: FAD-dependent oxidoreductase [Blautia sp.]|uniref:FAD-dependent oxidoreductase n=1 Tax=Blautia sp. TaxID=1955243 RepID=UPI0025B94A0D|nr:FAD-dependent oxidoreductase [Blautia sp.]MCI6302611.1 FAD-dependent oxidoreductase [Blautia sp.]